MKPGEDCAGDGAGCEYNDPQRVPATVEGWACWHAAEASLRGGMVSPHVDAAVALALAAAQGVPAAVAAPLILAVQAGACEGLARKRGNG